MTMVDDDTKAWMAIGACVTLNPSYFFTAPVGATESRSKVKAKDKERQGNKSVQDRIRRETIALAACSTCPVQQPCKDYADANVIDQGTWGGELEEDRLARWKKERRFRIV